MSGYAAYDSLLSVFTDSIEFVWEQPNDPLVESQRFAALANSLKDLTPVLEASREVVVADVEEHFHEERGPTGESWAEWSPSYAPVASSKNIGKLRRRDTQDLYEAATDRTSYPIVGNEMFIDTGSFPVYWAIHQYGGLIMSTGTLLRRYGMRRRGEAKASQHGRIPARPYLGMSEEAEAKVFALFDQFIAGEIIEFVENPLHGPGRIQPRLRSGRYGKILR